MRWFLLLTVFLIAAAVLGLRVRGTKFSQPPFELFNDMDRQYKVKYQKPSSFFDNGSGSRRPVKGTVPMGFIFPISKEKGLESSPLDFSSGDGYYSTGRFGDYYGKGFPKDITIDEAFLKRGQQRYQINCVPCHGESGNGQGIISKYWMVPPTTNLVDARVAAFPEGQIFSTITEGKGLMGSYKGTITVRDRWAITAYVKALQSASTPQN